jgi:hypothetical protein
VKRGRAAAPYAKALFGLAKERDQIELIGRELGEVAATFEGDLELRDSFARPWTPKAAKRTVATEVAQRSGLSRGSPATFARDIAQCLGVPSYVGRRGTTRFPMAT